MVHRLRLTLSSTNKSVPKLNRYSICYLAFSTEFNILCYFLFYTVLKIKIKNKETVVKFTAWASDGGELFELNYEYKDILSMISIY